MEEEDPATLSDENESIDGNDNELSDNDDEID